MDNTEIFLEFWRTYRWSEPQPVLFRLYHDDAGWPLQYSQDDLPGLFVDITPEQYVQSDFRVRVINGEIIPQEPPAPPKLTKAYQGVTCHPTDVTVITDQEPFQAWSMKTDEN